jgi:hypothetical protein
MGLGAGDLVDELCDHHAVCVNPNDLSMNHSFFEDVLSGTKPVCTTHPAIVFASGMFDALLNLVT